MFNPEPRLFQLLVLSAKNKYPEAGRKEHDPDFRQVKGGVVFVKEILDYTYYIIYPNPAPDA